MKQNFLAFKDSPIIPLRRSPSLSAPPATSYLSPMPTTPVSMSSPSVVSPSPLNTSTASSLSNTSSTSTSPGTPTQLTPTPMAVTPKKKSGGGRKRDAQQQQGGPPKKAKVSRYFLLAPGCTQDDYSKKGAKPGKPRKNDKHLPVDIRWGTMKH